MDKPGTQGTIAPTILDSVPKGATVSKVNVKCRPGLDQACNVRTPLHDPDPEDAALYRS